MAGFGQFAIGCVLSGAVLMVSSMSARAVPLAVPDVKIDWLADVEPILDRGPYGGYGVYRPGPYYGAGPYTHYRPFYGDRPYYRPYDRPYVRPGVQVYIAPRPVYRDRYVVPGGSHVNWCVSRYRSYNPATNRFLAYGGVYKICRSPYR